jgi:hypothetical protein
MIRSVDVECAFTHQLLGASSSLEGPFNFGRMEKDSRITIALQRLVLHAFVAGRVSTFAGGCVDQNFSLRQSRCRIEEELAGLQLEGATDRVQAGT